MDDHMDTGSNSGAEDGAVGGMQAGGGMNEVQAMEAGGAFGGMGASSDPEHADVAPTVAAVAPFADRFPLQVKTSQTEVSQMPSTTLIVFRRISLRFSGFSVFFISGFCFSCDTFLL